MDTRYLTYILAIADRKNMTKAAEDLYVSQSSLSQYLTKLELELGTPLFFRAKGELLLTPAGELYVSAARQVLQIKKQLYKDISNLDQKGHITIGTTSQFGLRILTDIIPKFKSQYPDVTIEFSEFSLPPLTKMLLEENIDLGLLAANSVEPFDPESVDVLKEEEVYFAIPADHPYRKTNRHDPIPQEELLPLFAGNNFLLSRKGSTLRILAGQLFRKYHYEPSAMCETNNILATRSMVARGAGVAFIAESCAHDEAHVAYYSLEPKLTRLNLLVRRKNWILNEPERQFCDYIRAAI